MRVKNQIGRDTQAWTSRADVQLKGVPNVPRILDLLNVCWSLRLQKRSKEKTARTTTEDLRRDLWVDLSQGVARKPLKMKPHLFRTSTINYSYEKDQALSGKEHMMLMGWPGHVLTGFDDHLLRTLAGECYSMPIATALDFIMYCNPWGEWWQQ